MRILLFIALLYGSLPAMTQRANPDSLFLLSLNQQLDSYVITRNMQALDTLYADDFVFSHGSGRIEGKAGWLKTVARADYPLRQHDSVSVELHDHIALVKGRMKIAKVNKDKTDRYFLRYLRLYVLRNKHWQLVSHHTTYEEHEP